MIFPASLNSLHEMLQLICLEARMAGFEDIKLNQIELALEEALVNIIKHGYLNSAGPIEIQCTVLPHPGIKFVLIDKGIPYNPLLNTQKNAHTVSMGGYGVYLMRKLMDQAEYEYKDGLNFLSLTKFN